MRKFITFEGGEGTGKSTQAKLLKEALEAKGVKVLLTREPGGSVGAELIRKLLVQGRADRWDAMVEALLLLAARRDHWFKTIEPALKGENLVICDRFIDSSLVYQGYAGGVDRNFLIYIHQKTLPVIKPDRTYIFDLPPEEGLARTLQRAGIKNTYCHPQLA